MRFIAFVLTTAALSLTTSAYAGSKAAADACAAKLSPEAKQVYAASIASVAPGVDLRETVRGKTKGLVMSGKLSRDRARPAAEEAGACLKQAL